ncbi:MAG TPA: SEC-C metal-binding domain-containing protein [Bacillota bacterium]|nr:SEC-C metal-binding domain-containing protein [Bacillota bacterium]
MKKIGRNEPCPCGSGKKYKKCCLNNPNPISLYLQSLWSYEEADEMSTDEIIQLLDDFGIPFEKDTFLQDIEEYFFAEQISENWFRIFDVTAKGRDEDFPWLAAWVLWERLAPAQNMPAEKMNRLINEGDQYSLANDPMKACDIWLEVWKAIKYKCKPEFKYLNDLDQQYRTLFFISNLCQDLELEFHNAGLRDKAYFKKRIDYCREFLTLFPDEKELITHNMRRAIADSYASLGDYEQAESEFKKLVQTYPNSPWGYIAWGDIYFSDETNDYDKAKELYAKALAVAEDKYDIMTVNERLKDLEEKVKYQEASDPGVVGSSHA